MVMIQSEGKAPREVGAERARQALVWVRRWGWTSATVLDVLTRSPRRGLAARLQRAQLIEPISLDFYAIAIAPLPKKILRLTKQGLDVAESLCDSRVIYDDIARPKPNQLLHDIKVQEIAAEHCAGSAKLIYSGAEVDRLVKSGKKPDAVLEINGKRTGIELELSKKREDEFYFGIEAICESVRNGKYSGYIIYCGTDSIAERYKSALLPNNVIDRYQRAENRHYKRAGNYTIPMDIRLLVQVVTL
jgi:hypothetical protein